MKKLILIILFIIPTILFSQKKDLIIGKWKWSNSNYVGEFSFDGNFYEMKLNIKGTDSRVSELVKYYKIKENKIYFSKYSLDSKNGKKNLKEYTIREIDEFQMTLIDPNGEVDKYTRVSSEKPEIKLFKINEFDASSGAISCATNEIKENYLSCLCIGKINFDTLESEIEKLHGKPHKVLANKDNSSTKIYLLKTSTEHYPYFAITFDNSSIESIQLTGGKPNENLSFSSIRLGDQSSFVLQKLGTPSQKYDVEEIQGELWDYAPFPFTIEFINNEVYSIRLTKK